LVVHKKLKVSPTSVSLKVGESQSVTIEGNGDYVVINGQYASGSLSENKIRGIAVDNLFNTYWVYTKNSIYEFVIENELILVWYDYYKMGKYSEALKYLDEDDENLKEILEKVLN